MWSCGRNQVKVIELNPVLCSKEVVPTSNESNNDMKPCLVDLGYFLFVQDNIVCVHDVKITRGVYTVLSPSPTLDHDLK